MLKKTPQSLFKRKSIMLMLTYECNLNCVYCYEKKKHPSKTMPLETAKCIIEKIFAENDKVCEEIEFDFMGGEPLLEFDRMKEIAEWMWSCTWNKPYILYATTNGTLLNDGMKAWFIQHKERIVLGLSYDGSPEMQNQNRNSSAVNIDIKYFITTWPFQPFKMTLSKETVGQLYKGVTYLHRVGMHKVHANLAFGLDWTLKTLDAFAKQLVLLIDFYVVNPELERVSLLNLDVTVIFHKTDAPKYCGTGSGTELVDYDGRVFPCHIISPVTLSTEQLKVIAQVDFENKSCFANPICETCMLVSICPNCYGMNLLHTGDLKKRFPVLCKGFIIQFMANCKLQAKLLTRKKELTEKEKKLAYALIIINKSKIRKKKNYE
ncbi:MAG: 4Fe-4S cluster-binding domain-containing protein [Bacteroidales bacterium]|nr:4Fe-4S cluster-binding domain-containing protein [Bacteroidales bacterium]